ncbi:Multisubstrate pseudouridine synthase 7 [Nakaseomyces bracarensis]|uniref:Multisubstrate pseudouridine synthase 7 n=1 Tax=Nakaseomyces bracarensis TaxID=273131 RepID=A0ABR4NVA8_9SACH
MSQKRAAEGNAVDPAQKKIKIEDADGVCEKDVGITYYISQQPGFRGQIKQRYTDFLVNEITREGEVVHLTDKGFKVPKKKTETVPDDVKKLQKEEEFAKRQNFTVEDELKAQLIEIFGDEDFEKILDVYRNAQKMESKNSFEDKSTRTKIHQLLRQAFNNELESVTTGENTFKIARNNKNSRVNKQVMIQETKDENGVENWGYGPAKEYIHFTLHKENKDTMEAVNVMTKLMRVPNRVVRYAGTKDRRAVTCQRLSISNIKLDRLNALNRTLKGMIIGGYKFSDVSMNLGELSGNEFHIVIRDASVSPDSGAKLEDVLEAGCKSLSENGFINYYGLQRFGTFSISTHTIGKELLLGNWKGAIDMILSDQVNVLPASKEARQLWAQNRDPNETLVKMPRQCIAENAILHALTNHKKGEDGDFGVGAYHDAIMKIPRNLRTMYVHAYQSFVWNKVASKRIQLFGNEARVGDLVIIQKDDKENEQKDEREEDDFDEDLRTSDFIRARALTQEDIDSNKYTIDDVVLPTPGFDILYPSSEELKQLYVEIMAADGMDPFEMRRKVRDFSLAGSYRNIIQKPKGLEYKVIHYDDPVQQIINTDLEILNNQRAKENHQKFMKAKLERYMPDKGGERTAVVIKFQLGTSAYATMALRELMKLETSRRGDMCEVTV